MEGFFRTRVSIHEFSTLLLQLVFRWGDADTKGRMGLLAINIEKIRGGVVTFKWKIRNRLLNWKQGGDGKWVGVHH